MDDEASQDSFFHCLTQFICQIPFEDIPVSADCWAWMSFPTIYGSTPRSWLRRAPWIPVRRHSITGADHQSIERSSDPFRVVFAIPGVINFTTCSFHSLRALPGVLSCTDPIIHFLFSQACGVELSVCMSSANYALSTAKLGLHNSSRARIRRASLCHRLFRPVCFTM